MAGLGAVMAIEKNASWGHRVTRPVGAVLIAEGLIVATVAATG
jgi:predicted metal-binding membrane protein